MAKPRHVRAFITLDKRELDFIGELGRLVQKSHGIKRTPRTRNIIQGVLMDYKRIIDVASAPDFLRAYNAASKYRRKGKASAASEDTVC